MIISSVPLISFCSFIEFSLVEWLWIDEVSIWFFDDWSLFKLIFYLFWFVFYSLFEFFFKSILSGFWFIFTVVFGFYISFFKSFFISLESFFKSFFGLALLLPQALFCSITGCFLGTILLLKMFPFEVGNKRPVPILLLSIGPFFYNQSAGPKHIEIL
jgi:hypothetical protein